MKKLFTMFFAVLLALSVEAENGMVNTRPKVMNYGKVVKQLKYPRASREEGSEGLVIVKLQIDEKGTIEKTTFVQYPNPNLKEAVKNILHKFNFEPALDENGKPTKGIVMLPVKFKLVI